MIRGGMILLVIMQHWLARLDSYESLSPIGFYQVIYNIKIYFEPFRMELLFFLSGMIVHKSIAKETKTYVLGKVRNLLYPYILWSLIYFLFFNFKDILSGDMEKPLIDMARIMVGAPGLTWFLCFLFIFFLVSIPVLSKIKKPAIVFSACVAFIVLFPEVHLFEGLNVNYIRETDLFYYFIYFYLGCLVGMRGVDIVNISKNKVVFFVSIASLIIVQLINFNLDVFKTSLVYLPFAILTIPLFVFVGDLLSRSNVISKALTHVSTNSIVYYLMQFLFLSIFAKILTILHVGESLHFPLVLILTIISTYLFILIKRRFYMLNFLFSPSVTK